MHLQLPSTLWPSRATAVSTSSPAGSCSPLTRGAFTAERRRPSPTNVPPLSSFAHPLLWRGVLVPSCARCSAQQGGRLHGAPDTPSQPTAPETIEAVVTRIIPPRIGTKRRPRRLTLGVVLADVAPTMGLRFHPWQRHVGDVSLELVERRRPGSRRRLAASTVGVMASRQTGKTAWCAARVAMQALLPDLDDAARLVGIDRIRPQHVAYLAQDRASALGRWHEHVDVLMASPLAEHVARVVLQRGDECVRFHNGSTYKVVTPSRTGARGLSLDLAIIDEALAHRSDLLAAVRPTMAQRDGAVGCIGAQLVIVSNAGDERSTLLNEQRELGRRAALEGDTARVWFEWSAPDDADPYDEDVWRATIPTLEQPDGIGLEFVRMEAESMRLDDFRREYLCVHTARPVARVIDPGPSLPGDEACPCRLRRCPGPLIGRRVAAGRSTTTTRCSSPRATSGAEWVADYVAAVAPTRRPVVVDAYGPMASLIPVLERAGVVSGGEGRPGRRRRRRPL